MQLKAESGITLSRPTRISYIAITVVFVLVAWLHLGTLVVSALFGYLALHLFCIRGKKSVSITLYLIAVVVIGAGMVYFSNLAYRTLPKIAETAIPAMVEYAEKNGIDLPFTDYASLKSEALDSAREGFAVVGRYARMASYQFVLLIAGLVVAPSLFLGKGWVVNHPTPGASANFYTAVTREFSRRFRALYESFARVMGAQIIIAAINTVLTAVFLLLNQYPYAGLLAVLVLLFGMFPIVGNLASNAVIVVVGFTVSPRTGLYALIFLVVIHKLEYFLNSKIVGRHINSPMWLTLIGLIVGERLMGIPGLILAPVLIHLIRVETSAWPAPSADPPPTSV